MFNLQKAGGIAALLEALAYVVSFVLMGTILNPGNTEGWSHAQKLSFVLESQRWLKKAFHPDSPHQSSLNLNGRR